jgi:ubiquinone/menaquinone biosynthesis C-methylase UbiE
MERLDDPPTVRLNYQSRQADLLSGAPLKLIAKSVNQDLFFPSNFRVPSSAFITPPVSNTTTSGLRLPPITPGLRQNFTWRYYYSGEFAFAKRAVQHVRWRRFQAACALLRQFPPPTWLVDVGCGPGESTLYLARELQARRALGVDISADCIWFGNQLAQANDLPARFAAAGATALPLRPASADLVVSFEMIEHVPYWRAFLADAARLLRPGGHLLVTTPNAFSIHGLLKAAYRRIRRFDRLNRAWKKDGDFYEVFLPEALIRQGLLDSGFVVSALRHVAFVLTVQPDWTLGVTRLAEAVMERLPGIRRLAVTTVVLARKPEASSTAV